jgi:hypothetical protein
MAPSSCHDKPIKPVYIEAMTSQDPNTLQTNPQPRKKRRILRWLAWAALIVVLLLLAATLTARYYLQPERLRQMAIQTVEKSMPRKMHIGNLEYHLLHGMVLNDVKIYSADTTRDLFPLHHLAFKQMRLHYSMRELLHRKFIVNEISLLEPELELFVDMATPSTIDLAALLATSLPIDFDVKKIRLQDAKFKIILADSLYSQSYRIGNMSILVDELHLPKKGWSANDSLLHGSLRILCEQTTLHLDYMDKPSNSQLQLDSDLQLDSRVDIRSFSDIRLSSLFKLGNVHLHYPPRTFAMPATFSLGLDAAINGKSGIVDLAARLGVDDMEWLRATVHADSLLQRPRFRLLVDRGEIPLNQVIALARHVLPDSLIPVKFSESPAPVFLCNGVMLEGRMAGPKSGGEFHFKVNGRLSNTNLADPAHSWLVRGIGFSILAEGNGDDHGLQNLVLQANAGLDSLNYTINDSMAVFSGPGRLYFYSRLNERLLPEKTRLSFSFTDCMGGAMAGELDLTGNLTLAGLAGKGRFSWSDIPLQNLAPMPLQGKISLRSDFSLAGLNRLAASVNLSSTPLQWSLSDRPLAIAALNCAGRIRGGMDTTFAKIHLDSILVDFNNIASMQAHAQIDMTAGEFSLDVDQVMLAHDALLEWIPASLKEKYSDVAVTGQTRMQLHGKGSIANGHSHYHLTGDLSTRNTSFYDPERFLAVGGIGLQSSWQLDDQSGLAAQIGLTIDSLSMSGGTPATYLHNRIALEVKSPDLLAFTVTQGELNIPDVKSNVKFTAHMQDTTVTARMEIHQAIPDSFVIREMVMRGATDIILGFKADPSLVDFLAEIHSRNWSLSIPGFVGVRGLQADVFVQQLYDVRKGQIRSRDEYLIATPAHAVLDYLLYGDFFRKRQPHLSHVTIDEVNVMNYSLQKIRMELLADQGRIEIPILEAILLGGNVTGRLSVDLAGGDLAGATYRMSGHFANINSYLLTRLASISKDDGVVNGNLEFRGSGLNPEKQMVLDGHFYITKIGPTAAGNLLNYLDPEAKDSGISTSRMLIRNGFKPKLMSFDFRNLHMYPVIEFTKPWYLPRGLDRIELNRIPLQFFMNRMRARAGWETASR